jgi:hypothetical protein
MAARRPTATSACGDRRRAAMQKEAPPSVCPAAARRGGQRSAPLAAVAFPGNYFQSRCNREILPFVENHGFVIARRILYLLRTLLVPRDGVFDPGRVAQCGRGFFRRAIPI